VTKVGDCEAAVGVVAVKDRSDTTANSPDGLIFLVLLLEDGQTKYHALTLF
jgi:hypothetical protein